jgi:putative membrane protein
MEVLLQILILIVVAILLIDGMLTGKISYYVHPRLNKAVWFSIVVLMGMALFRIPYLKNTRHNIAYWPYLVILFPILTGFTISPVAVKTSMSQQLTQANIPKDSYKDETQDLVVEQVETAQDLESTLNEAQQQDSPPKEIMVEKDMGVDVKQKYKAMDVNGVTVISDDYFIQWNIDVYEHMETLKGREFSFLAQAYPIEGLAEHQIVFGRLLMICCAADAGLYGVLGETEQASSLEEGCWVNITGTLDITQYQGEKTPILKAIKLEKAVQPQDIYVYNTRY